MTVDIGTVRIKNVSGDDYPVEELGGHIVADQEIINLMDQDLPIHYDSWEAANSLVTRLVTAKLYQDIQAGDIQLIENTPPIG